MCKMWESAVYAVVVVAVLKVGNYGNNGPRNGDSCCGLLVYYFFFFSVAAQVRTMRHWTKHMR